MQKSTVLSQTVDFTITHVTIPFLPKGLVPATGRSPGSRVIAACRPSQKLLPVAMSTELPEYSGGTAQDFHLIPYSPSAFAWRAPVARLYFSIFSSLF